MYLLTLYASLAGYAAFAAAGGITPGLTILVSICVTTLLLYVAALLGLLEVGAYAVAATGIAALLIWGLVTRHRVLDIVKQPTTWTIGVAAALLAIFASKWLNTFEFLSWDEFSHWGLVSKYLVAENRLFDTNSPIMFLTYPPGTALFQYQFSKIVGYSEGMVLLAQVTLFTAALLASASRTLASPSIALATISVEIFVVYVLGFQLYEVTVDHVLGALLGAVVAISLTFRGDWRITAALASVLAFLPLVKHVGLAFAFVGLCVVLVAILFDFLAKRLDKRELLYSMAAWSIACLAVAGAELSWRAYYHSLGVSDSYGTSVNLHNVAEFFFFPTSERHLQVWQEFWTRFAGQPSKILAFLLAFSAFYIFIMPRPKRLRQTAILAIVAVGSVGFTMLLLLSYGYYFSEYEAVRLASFERYLNSYYLAWAIALIAVFGARLAAAGTPFWLKIVISIAAVICLLTNPLARRTIIEPSDQRIPDYASRSDLRNRSQLLAEIIDRVSAPNDKAYYIDQGSDGYSYFMFRYEMAPRKINPYCWSLGAPYSASDIHTCDKPIAGLLKGYEFVAIASADNRFWSDFGYLFSADSIGHSPAVFRVSWIDGQPKLSRVQ